MVFFFLCASPIMRVPFLGRPSLFVSYLNTFPGRRLAHETLTWSGAAERIENVYQGLV